MNCDILLFDLDGTLTDSGPGIMHAAQYALRGGGIEVADSSTLSFFVGPPLADSFLRYFPPQEVGAAIARFREYYHETGWLENAPYPGIETCLQALCATGKTLYVATSKLETLAFQVLSYFGLDRYFAGIFGAPPDDVDAIVQTIDRCFQSPALEESIAAAGRRDAMRQTWAHSAERYIQLFKELQI